MKTISLAFAVAYLVSSSFVRQTEHGWRGIVPLHSKRADVERLLGPPGGECKCIYSMQDGGVFVQYATDPCKGALPGGEFNLHGWNVPSDTVLRFTVYSRIEQRFSDLRLDLSKYLISQDDSSTSYYASRDRGVEYEVSWEGTIKAISYIPSTRDRYLRCRGFPLEDGSIHRQRPFDQYGDLDFAKEKIRLDGLAIILQREPDIKGYIIVYAGRRDRPSEAKARSERAKKYLIKERGIKSESIITMDGGHREDFAVELYAVQPGAIAPIATPTLAPSEAKIIKNGKTRSNNRSSSRLTRKRLRS